MEVASWLSGGMDAPDSCSKAPVSHDFADVVGDGAIDSINAKAAKQHEAMERRQFLVAFRKLDRFGSVGVVPAFPLVLVLLEVVEQRSELIGEL